MNKTILVLALPILFASCAKNKKRCWQCTAIYTMPLDSTSPPTITKTNVDAFCNKTTDEIRFIEGKSFASSNGGYELQTFSNCKKK